MDSLTHWKPIIHWKLRRLSGSMHLGEMIKPVPLLESCAQMQQVYFAFGSASLGVNGSIVRMGTFAQAACRLSQIFVRIIGH